MDVWTSVTKTNGSINLGYFIYLLVRSAMFALSSYPLKYKVRALVGNKRALLKDDYGS